MGIDPSEREFAALRDLVRDRFGLWYDDQKRFLLLSRLRTRLAKRGCETYAEYIELLSDAGGAEEWTQLASVLSNNETYFFRERAQLTALAGTVVDECLERAGGVRLWSAACSTGEEPYSLAMTLLDGGKVRDTQVSIRATDLSPRALEAAVRGSYAPLSFRATAPALLERWFQPRGSAYEIDARIKRLVRFGRLNLLDATSVAAEGPFDAIFCRNVLIYFDRPTQKRIVESLAGVLRPGGYLFLGHAESLFHLTDRYAPVIGPDAIFYRLRAPVTA